MRMQAVVAFLASACLSCVAQVNASPRVLAARDLAPVWTTDDMRKAAAAVEAGDWDTARTALLQSETGDATDAEMPRRRFLLGYACVQAGDPLGAVAVLDELENEIPPAANWVRHLRGQALFDLGRHDEAIAAFQSVNPDSPLFREAQSRAAEALTTLGRHAEAAAAWERSGRRDPEALARRAAAMAEAGRKADALGLLRRAYFKTAASGRRLFRAAMEALGLSPVEPQPAEVLDQAQAMLDAHMNREADLETTPLVASEDLETRCRALMIRGLARQKLRRHPDALGDFTAAIDGCGNRIDRARALFLAVRSAFRGGDRDRGDALAERLRTEFPDASFNDDVALTRARIAVSRGDPAAATRILEDSLATWPDGDMADETRWLLAWAAYRARDLEGALTRLREGARRATDLDDRSRFAYWEARVLQRLGRKDEARRVLEATVLAFPLKYHAWLALNRLTAMAGKKATPGSVLDALLQGTPRGRPFLVVDDPGGLDSGAIGRALWLSRTGLPSLAARELSRPDRDVGAEARWLGAWLLDLGNRHTQSHRLAASLLAEAEPFWPDGASGGYFQLAYPRPHAPLVAAAAKEAGIEPALIWGVMRQESAFVVGIESRANAIGLMQLILPTAESMAKRLSLTATPRTLRQPEVNIRLGAAYLSLLIRRFGQPLLAIPGYNAGGGAIAKGLKSNPGLPLDEFVETIGAEETRKYARKVFESYAAYRFLYNQGDDRFTRVDFARK